MEEKAVRELRSHYHLVIPRFATNDEIVFCHSER